MSHCLCSISALLLTHFLAFAAINFECYAATSVWWHLVDICFLVGIWWELKGMKRLQCSLEILGGLRHRSHYNMAMQDSCSIQQNWFHNNCYYLNAIYLYIKIVLQTISGKKKLNQLTQANSNLNFVENMKSQHWTAKILQWAVCNKSTATTRLSQQLKLLGD